ncbi:MAG: aminoacyl-histidine dipeptidase [Flavobacteriales bacterium]
MAIHLLEPSDLWRSFAALNAVPRPSKKEARIRKFMLDFGQGLGLETLEDTIGNVIIKKPATAGMENRVPVILQSHLDMVHQKNETTVFDFDQEGIKMHIDGDWVLAEGTTLGADNGIGVAAIMALLQSKDIAHPALEALFTIDEETGMTGAKQLDGSLLNGRILLNLDTEDDDELSIGCAGGIDTNTTYTYQETSIHNGWEVLKIKLRGLVGGHSGMDINKGRGNANKWMARLLWELKQTSPIQLISFDGGSLRNAIPREATCSIAVPKSDEAKKKLLETIAHIKQEYQDIEPEHTFEIESVVSSGDAMIDSDCTKILNTLCAVHNGVFRMSPQIKDLVEASSSLARVIIHEGTFTTQSLQRSSVESTKTEVSMAIRSAFENMGATVEQGGDYPGWEPNRNSRILTLMENLYKQLFNEAPHVKACHAGLECGILGKHLPGVEMISFGPNIRAAHSPDEKVQISSVQKFWSYLLETLKQIPQNA